MPITISGNNISNNGGDGVRITGEIDLIIDGNTITNNGGQGLNIRKFDQDIDEETEALLKELRDALNKKDSVSTKRIFSAIVDKGIDIAIAIAAGLVFK